MQRTQPFGAEAHLRRTLLGTDVEGALHPRGQQLQQERGLADARFAAEQRDRTGHDAIAQHTVDGHAGGCRAAGRCRHVGDGLRHRRRAVHPGIGEHRVGPLDVFDQGVPHAARGALARPLGEGCATVGATMHESEFGHAVDPTRGVSHGRALTRFSRGSPALAVSRSMMEPMDPLIPSQILAGPATSTDSGTPFEAVAGQGAWPPPPPAATSPVTEAPVTEAPFTEPPMPVTRHEPVPARRLHGGRGAGPHGSGRRRRRGGIRRWPSRRHLVGLDGHDDDTLTSVVFAGDTMDVAAVLDQVEASVVSIDTVVEVGRGPFR